ncbi:RNA-binding S4 domain-containing protein [Georgenia faecalis]|uniref:RNA-binding S4 domain-containing protein n=1 Tax=Georgenia faecalis TaxID=2483799 RepID=A0ABV9DCD1_9MICO|nr:RNA-binding S4 domain-containing protein [Georgenia faecalis]
MSDDVPTVPTTDGTIRLGQFLKLAGLVDSGSDARELIAEGEVRVDGEVETRRGRQLSPGALVQVDRPAGTVSARVG